MILIHYDFKLKVATRLILALFIFCVSFCLVAQIHNKNDFDDSNDPANNIMPTSDINEVIPTEAKEVLPLNDTPILFTELIYTALYDIDKCNAHIEQVSAAAYSIEEAINSAEYTPEAISKMCHEQTRLYGIISYTEADIRHYTKWEHEHYYAAKTFEFFMQQGFSPAVASGIIGNMMVETSGGTLNLKPEIYSPGGSFYGLCQWNKSGYPEAHGMSFNEQLSFLMSNIAYEFNTYGRSYKSGFYYESFLNLEDPADAALAFAKVYERCGSGSYSARQKAANIAYNYFVKGA